MEQNFIFKKYKEEIELKETKKWRVLIADDEEQIHEITKLVLKNVKFDNLEIEFIDTYSEKETKEVLRAISNIAVLFLDVVMENDDSGLNVVRHIREELENNSIQIVMRTGQTFKIPPKEIIENYEINDYKEKTELTADKLYMSLIQALRSYKTLDQLTNNKHALKGVAKVSSDLFSENIPSSGLSVVEEMENFEIIEGISEDSIKKRNQTLKELVKNRTEKLENKNIELIKIQKSLEMKQEELKNALNNVRRISRTDLLTKLPNRRYMLEKINEEIERYKRNGKNFSIIIADIDFFKKFNDTYGHEIGDLVLKEVSKTLNKTKRETDFLARWGGEEFLIILPETTIDQALISAERFRKDIMDMKCKCENEILKVTMTFGISEYNKLLNIDKNIDQADQALYEGKKERNCCICYDNNIIL